MSEVEMIYGRPVVWKDDAELREFCEAVKRAWTNDYAPICEECASKVKPELWELTMSIVPQPCIYCGKEAQAYKERRQQP